MLRKLYPIEKIALFYLLLFFLFSLIFSLQIYLPNNLLDHRLTNRFWGIVKNEHKGTLVAYLVRLMLSYFIFLIIEIVKNMRAMPAYKKPVASTFAAATIEYSRI